MRNTAQAPRITKDEFAAATAELRATELTSDFALTPARLPWSAHRAMRATWTAFRQGVEAIIEMHGEQPHRVAAALSLPDHLPGVWDSLPPHHWAMIARPDVIIHSGGPVIIDVNSTSLAGHFATNDLLLRAHRRPELRPFFATAGEPASSWATTPTCCAGSSPATST